MLTEKEIGIIGVFRKDIFKSYTIRELMKKTGRRTYTWTFNTANKLAKLKMINMETKGKSKVCTINLYSQLAISYLSLLDRMEALSKNIPHLDELVWEMPSPFFTFIIAGSYAEGNQMPNSDLDVCVVVDDTVDAKFIQGRLQNKLMVPELHPLVFKKSEFLGMLLNKEMNYGKLLFRKRLIAFGAENYYLIVREAIEHGFRG